jgi:hypothetical protein
MTSDLIWVVVAVEISGLDQRSWTCAGKEVILSDPGGGVLSVELPGLDQHGVHVREVQCRGAGHTRRGRRVLPTGTSANDEKTQSTRWNRGISI